MLSPELEKLIDLAVADGEISELERKVLEKKVIETGADRDEFEMTLQAKLYMVREKQNVPPVVPPMPAPNNKLGDVRKCPRCGAPYSADSIYCTECGHEFTGMRGNSSVERFSKMLQNIETRNSASSGSLFKDTLMQFGFGNGSRQKQISMAISTFPIPNSKEDLLEFILFLKPKADRVKRGIMGRISTNIEPLEFPIYQAYKDKYEECLNKASFYISEDATLVERLRMNGIELGKKKKRGLF